MSYIQLRKPNLSTTGVSGFCLNYSRRVFSVSNKYLTAWSAWSNARYKHPTRTLPNVAVPVWFIYYKRLFGIYQNWGHVAVYVPKKGIYSTSRYGVKVFKSLTELEKAIPGIKYVGWSEDINAVRLVKPATTTAATAYYKVVKGDTVSAICAKYKLSLAKFKSLNPGIKDINLIYPGQKVRIK